MESLHAFESARRTKNRMDMDRHTILVVDILCLLLFSSEISAVGPTEPVWIQTQPPADPIHLGADVDYLQPAVVVDEQQPTADPFIGVGGPLVDVGRFGPVVGNGGWVDYQGYQVSDVQVREKLQDIANLFGKRLWLTSGDRQGSSPSHHNLGRAADFWIDGGLSGGAMFDRIRQSGILARDYQVIWHGRNTCTLGQHLHIGRYGDYLPTCWVNEGTDPSNICIYRCM